MRAHTNRGTNIHSVVRRGTNQSTTQTLLGVMTLALLGAGACNAELIGTDSGVGGASAGRGGKSAQGGVFNSGGSFSTAGGNLASNGGAYSSGGTPAVSGSSAGGNSASSGSGGSPAVAGQSSAFGGSLTLTGGTFNNGGAAAKGGTVGSGGKSAGTGGKSAGTGGKSAGTGGKSAGTGGKTSTGGSASTGGTLNSGGKASTGGVSTTGGTVSTTTGGSPSTGASTAAAVAKKLGRKTNFLIGLGNDLADDHNEDGAYTVGVTLDLHYAYLVGLKDQGGWTDWNENGTFVNMLADTAKAHGVTPMYTLYAMAAQGEGNTAALVDDSYMKPYWDGVKILFQRLADFDGPALVQFEPDFWGYMQQASSSKPASLPVHVGKLATDCASLPDTLVGMGKCLVSLGRKYAPKAVLAFEVSEWGDPDPAKVAKFLLDVGAADADLLTTDILDRDAGCFEAHSDEACQRDDGPWYWDETNQTKPNFHDYLSWIRSVTTAAGKPILWWQTPLGVASTTRGGSSGRYRDNRVKYIFEHVQEFVDAGGLGAAFGVGAGNQTYITTDGGQFKNAVTKYYAAPVPLP